MKTKALTIHFVHQAEIAQLWRTEAEAMAFCTDPDKKQYNPRLWVYVTDFGWAEMETSEVQF